MIQKYITVLILSLSLLSVKAQDSEMVKTYINTYCGIAVEEMNRTGVPAAIKLAQGILETTAGQSPLVVKSNNHFGIKCKQGYSGPYVLHDDDRPQERFMKYDDARQSYKDHSDFLKSRSRYALLFELDPTDYSGWAYGLKKAGYATNPKYPQLLINLIEKYGLAEYTLMGLGKVVMNENVKNYLAKGNNLPPTPIPTIETPQNNYPDGDFLINNTKVIFAKAGTSLNDIASKYSIPVNKLFDLNDFADLSKIEKNGTLVFLQLKRTISEKPLHTVKDGENLYDIAQAEGIRLDALLKYNKLNKYNIPTPGSQLKLRDDDATAIATLHPASTSNL